MEKISKIYAVILDRSEKGYGSGGNCKVVSLLRNGNYVTGEEDILNYFATDRKLFSNKIFDFVPDLMVRDLIEITPQYINKDVEQNRNYYVSLQSVKKIGTPVVDIPSEYLEQDFIDLDIISKYLSERNLYPNNHTQIYLCNNESIFGPFRISNYSITPVQGRHTYSFEYDINELIEDDDLNFIFLISEPKSKIKAIDCSTPTQLVDFLKGRLQIDRVSLNLLTKIGKQINDINNGASELDVIRLKRASDYIGQLSMSLEELFTVLSKEDLWNHEIGNIVDIYRDEFKNFALLDINNLIKKIEDDLAQKQSELLLTENKIEKQTALAVELKKEIEYIENHKDELILNVKLLAGLQSDKPLEQISYSKNIYDIIQIENNPVFDNIDDFYDNLKDNYNIKINNGSIYEDGILLLKENSFLVAKSAVFVLNLIPHLGKTEILLQNAEVDWLKFSFWRENGLEEIVNKATLNKELNYIYILQDFNIASFECYGKPILDIANNIRKSLFGSNSFPNNLKIILIQADEEIEDFAFSLNKSTFKNWKFLPGVIDVPKIDFPVCDGIDLLNFIVDRPVEDYSINYF
ncbi:hypothetical protein [Chryseobacterium indologenes]|uniref:hypothetical protein n=1 Tax=Chryseobacterium indologenes TaxID=253 RepID=UPI001BCB4133|nr:hypothetical protein [Chryseobacterium indologenes]